MYSNVFCYIGLTKNLFCFCVLSDLSFNRLMKVVADGPTVSNSINEVTSFSSKVSGIVMVVTCTEHIDSFRQPWSSHKVPGIVGVAVNTVEMSIIFSKRCVLTFLNEQCFMWRCCITGCDLRFFFCFVVFDMGRINPITCYKTR